MEEKLMTSGEAATYLDVSRQQIHRLVQAGKLQAQRAGDFLLFQRAELDRYRSTPKSKGGRPKERARTIARAGLA
ncbi:MAG: helix-turn-helix domain-containing protein [Chloroflexota bacterium]|nr:helix-turn-helix domain-containing protein [Chloroflexota bacterium]